MFSNLGATHPSLMVLLFLQFPDYKREYCRVNRTQAQMDAFPPYCASTEADLMRMKRELYSPGRIESQGPMERTRLISPKRSFSPDVHQICHPRYAGCEIDECTWAVLEGRMRSTIDFPSQAYPIPRS